jgi:group I intron endonuclease
LEEKTEGVIEVQESLQVDDEKKWCVYMHTSPSGKRYVGITSQKPESRWGPGGSGYLCKNANGTYRQPAMAKAILKYPNWDEWKHEILLTQETKKHAGQEEKRLIALYNCCDRRYGYNISPGGEGAPLSEESKKKISEANKGRFVGDKSPNYGKPMSDETKRKLSEAKKGKYRGENNPNYGNHKLAGENNPFYGKTHTEETKEKLRQANLGKKLSDETKKKIGDAERGEKNHNFGKEFSEETRRKMSEATKKRFEDPTNHPMYGTHRSEETKQKLREKHLGKQASEETKRKISESSPIQTPVYCIELNTYFKGPAEAQRITGVKQQSISECCKGRGSRKSAGKHPVTGEKLHWIYVSIDEYLNNLKQKGNN